jgi:predicted lactoylglutathione lyase
MARKIFVNLPIADMQRSRAFFEALGFAFNPQFTNDQGACMVISDDIYAMLLTRPFYATFTKKQIADATQVSEVLVCLSCDSREEVDALVAKAVAAGATTPNPPQDHGFMYGHGFDDLDGHTWELSYMDMSAMPPGPEAAS